MRDLPDIVKMSSYLDLAKSLLSPKGGAWDPRLILGLASAGFAGKRNISKQKKNMAINPNLKFSMPKLLLSTGAGGVIGATIGKNKTIGKLVQKPFTRKTMTTGDFSKLMKDPNFKKVYDRTGAGHKIWDKKYWKEIGEDIKSPLSSYKRQFNQVKYRFDKDKLTNKISVKHGTPAGKALEGYQYFGLPISGAFAYSTDNKRSSGSKLGRASSELATTLTPKMLPYFAISSAADSIFKENKKKLQPIGRLNNAI